MITAIILILFTIAIAFIPHFTEKYYVDDNKIKNTILLTNGTDQDLSFNESSVIILYCNPKNTTDLCEHYMTIAETRHTPLWFRCDGALDIGNKEADKVHDFVEKCLEE